eukprot:scaffold1970_cov396-Prasinococcus_capsulatus_cf.AAC.4
MDPCAPQRTCRATCTAGTGSYARLSGGGRPLEAAGLPQEERREERGGSGGQRVARLDRVFWKIPDHVAPGRCAANKRPGVTVARSRGRGAARMRAGALACRRGWRWVVAAAARTGGTPQA